MEQLILNMNTMMERMEAIETQLSKNVEPMKMNDTLVKTVKATKTTSPKEAKAQKSKIPLMDRYSEYILLRRTKGESWSV